VVESANAGFKAGNEVVVHGVDHDGGHSRMARMARVPGDWVPRIPDKLSPFEAAVMGAAGYTAAYPLQLMELYGLAPDQGPVLVDGATGGFSSAAIDMLAQRGIVFKQQDLHRGRAKGGMRRSGKLAIPNLGAKVGEP